VGEIMVRLIAIQLIILLYVIFAWTFVFVAPCIAQESANLGIFDATADWGTPDNPVYGWNKVPGRVEIGQSQDGLNYDVFGNGDYILRKRDEGFYVYTEKSGSWTMTARLRFIDQGGWNNHASLMLMIRENPQALASKQFSIVEVDAPFGNGKKYGHLIREKESGVSPSYIDNKLQEDLSNQGIYFRTTRYAPSNLFYSEYSFDGTNWNYLVHRSIKMKEMVAYGIAITNQADNLLLAHAHVDNVTFEPVRPFAIRYFSQEQYRPGNSVQTVLKIINPGDEVIQTTIRETFPQGWSLTYANPSPTQSKNHVEWSMSLQPGLNIVEYQLQSPGDSGGTVEYSGKIDSAGIMGNHQLQDLRYDIVYPETFRNTVMISLIIIHLAIFLFDRKLKEHLCFTMYLIFSITPSFLTFYLEVSTCLLWKLSNIFTTLSLIALLAFFYLIIDSKIHKRLWFLCLILLSISISFYFVHFTPVLTLIAIFSFIIALESIRTLIKGLIKRVSGILIIVIGALPLFLFILLFVSHFFGLSINLGLLGLDFKLFFILSISVFLAYKHVRTNSELVTLNAELEDRVTHRTQELNSMNVELQEANAQLIQIDQMKTQFVSQASHDLRTPLTAIKGSLDNLLMGIAGALNEKQQKVMTRATTSVDRLTNLINDVLDLNRIETGRIVLEKSDIPFKTLVENIINENQPAAEMKHITLNADFGKDLNLHIDGSKIERVVGELISNAIKYTPNDGCVDVSLSCEDDIVSLSVMDSGIGMTPEECEKIWERFYRTSASIKFAKGSGLGLSIAKELVELHGGTLGVISEQNQGTTFTLRLPINNSD
jgi:signal transduction histidine kinase